MGRAMYKITQSLRELLYMMECEEIPSEMIADTLEAVGLEVEQTADEVATMLAEIAADCEKLKAEEQRLRERRKKLEMNAGRLKEQLLLMLQTAEKKSVKTALHSFSVRRTAKAIVVSPDNLTDEYFRIPKPAPPEMDMKKIAKAIKDGKISEDVAFLQEGYYIVIK